ncbi:MAG: geranylgeranyl reductase family protein [Acidimicrobiia bacterium]|nr:geranylgeranyl reductase family protein [Acidimicrobiia bacterium]
MAATADVETVVVGAGPAGVAAALTLHRAGHGVLLVDKATFPRDKTCGDGLTTLALRELDALGLDPAHVGSWTPVHRTLLHSPSGRIVTLPLPDGPGTYAAIARRLDLDAALVALAEAEGVRVEQGVTLTEATSHADRIELDLGRLGVVTARWTVGADGMWSPLRRALGIDGLGYRGEWHAFRQYFRGTGPEARDLHVWFEPDLVPGYVWSFPLGDGATNVGFGVLRGARLDGKALARLWPQLLERPTIRRVLGADAEPESPHRAWPIPAGIRGATLSRGRALFVGDAARAPDVLTGEGIGQALVTGRLAAATLIGDGRSDMEQTAVAARYSAAVHEELSADHRMASILTTVMSNRTRAELAIRTVGLTEWNRRNFGRWLFEDSPRGIALMPRRWHRGALSGPPAFLRATTQHN